MFGLEHLQDASYVPRLEKKAPRLEKKAPRLEIVLVS
jgi:hypothetical protein